MQRFFFSFLTEITKIINLFTYHGYPFKNFHIMQVPWKIKKKYSIKSS